VAATAFASGKARLHLAQPRFRDMAERKVGVRRERAIEQRLGPGIGRQHQIGRGDIIRGGS
jgi:hypothetical protein